MYFPSRKTEGGHPYADVRTVHTVLYRIMYVLYCTVLISHNLSMSRHAFFRSTLGTVFCWTYVRFLLSFIKRKLDFTENFARTRSDPSYTSFTVCTKTAICLRSPSSISVCNARTLMRLIPLDSKFHLFDSALLKKIAQVRIRTAEIKMLIKDQFSYGENT